MLVVWLLTGFWHGACIAKVETNPFARADLEHQLLMVDDDMKLETLPQTNNIKSIVTAELPMDLEKKGKLPRQAVCPLPGIG